MRGKKIGDSDLDDLFIVAKKVMKASKKIGAKFDKKLSPALDSKMVFSSQSGLSIHQKAIPVRMSGLGTKRLTTLAIQKMNNDSNSIMLIDEIELGLEPHRLRHLLRSLRPNEGDSHQVFITTHSNISIVELSSDELFLMKPKKKKIKIITIPSELQDILRKNPEAFFGRKLLVCEGKTEIGFCRSIDKFNSNLDLEPFGFLGLILVDGNGDELSTIALKFKSLGFNTGVFCDSDVEVSPSIQDLESEGVIVFQWPGNVSIEERIWLDSSIEVLQAIIDKYIEITDGKDDLLHQIQSYLKINKDQSSSDISALIELKGEEQIRKTLGKLSKKSGWFKRIDLGEILGDIVINSLSISTPVTELETTVAELSEWIYG